MHQAMRLGNEPSSGLFYEVLGDRHDDRPPLLLIHGGGATGACFRATLEGAPGWADLLTDGGHEVWVTDWPGCGRSGGRNVVDIEYADVVEGYRRLLRDVIGVPVVVIPHSMGGATAWQLVEHDRDLVAGVVAVAAASPGNIVSPSTVLEDDGRIIRVRFEQSGAEFTVDRLRGYIYEDDYIYRQGIHTSTRFPTQLVDRMRSGLVPFSPRMLLQRMGVVPGMPPVSDQTMFKDLRVRLVAGTEDPAHTREIEVSTVELLSSWGAAAELIYLGDRGIVGNGHFLMFENNNAEVLEVIAEAIAEVAG